MRRNFLLTFCFLVFLASTSFVLFSCISKTGGGEVGYTHSVYYYRTSDLNARYEDNIIELRYDGEKPVDGFFWGTSDEFDCGREDYRPGAIVLQMKDLKISNDTISFTLDSRGQIFFSNAIDVNIHSCEEAQEKGSRLWLQNPGWMPFRDTVRYKGIIHDDTIGIDYIEEDSECSFGFIRYFVRKSLEEIKAIDRRLPEEEDIANSILCRGKMDEDNMGNGNDVDLDSLMNIDYEKDGLITYYRFPVSGRNDSIPSKDSFLCGFDVDKDGLMYFAGGIPLQVACFSKEGKLLIYRRVIEGNSTKMDLFHTRHDSIYIIDENKNELMRMHRDGSGDVVRMKLKDDTIRQCQFKDDCFLAFKEEEKEEKILSSGEFVKNKWNQKTYDYGGNLLDERTIEVCYLDMLVMDAPVKESVEEEKEGGLWYYKDYRGRYKGLYLYWCAYILENGMYYEIQLTDKDGNIKYRRKISDDAVVGETRSTEYKEFGFLHFPRYEIVRNNKFYHVGFPLEENCAVVTCIDLEVAFPDL
ncbi:MAG: hypothetical protein LUD00_10605 [Prevotellaceae bacterium]|nr:hypothetical protein [Prevotellaceae bacterium]